jgi:release factor glutamine methyltransferase
MTKSVEIREIILSDNETISKIIKSVLTELKANIKGTAYYDDETDAMFEAYQEKNEVYFVALLDDEIVGGCGIKKLQHNSDNICELQKMYILPKSRGHKIGKNLLRKCLDFAKKSGFDKCYLETFPQMTSAIRLYQKNGFSIINHALGDTSHYSCDVWMLKNLDTEKLTIFDLKKQFVNALKDVYPNDEIINFFHFLTDDYLNLKRVDIALNPGFEIDSYNNHLFQKAIKNLKSNIPIQYIIGKTGFYSLDFKVNKHVLIPRPETEELVDWIISDTKSTSEINIIDIGTGSGCIAISLAKNIKNAKVTALDISKEALKIAQENTTINEVKIDFIKQNILENSSKQFKPFDIIVSNPPYVRVQEKSMMHENVLANEPHLALFVTNENPLQFYISIADFALEYLTNNGFLYFEINQYLGSKTTQMLQNKGFKNIILKKDILGNDRMIRCTKP